MRVVLVMDCDWRYLGVAASDIEATGHEAIPFNSPLRALAYCERPTVPLDAVFINLNFSGAGAGLWLADQITRARPDLPVTVTSYVFRTVPETMSRMICLRPKPVTSAMLRELVGSEDTSGHRRSTGWPMWPPHDAPSS